MVAALVLASAGCSLDVARLPDGTRGKPWRVPWRFALAQASRDFVCPESQIASKGSFTHDFRFSGCGKSGRYSCVRRKKRAPEDIEQELDHVWEDVYECRRVE